MKFAEYTSSLDALPVPEWIIAERYMYCDVIIIIKPSLWFVKI